MKNPIHRLITAVLAGISFFTTPAYAEKLPLWEAGGGLATFTFPYYRGSSEYKTYLLPIPYVQYRGEFLKIDRGRVRGMLYQSDLAELDFSLSGSIPVNSGAIEARRGMPDLDPSFEIGPSINVHLYRASDHNTELTLRLPVRTVWTTKLQDTGILFQPMLRADIYDIKGSGWGMGIGASGIFADQRYHQHYYDVAPTYATADRPAYSAQGGYSGTQIMATLGKRYSKVWVGGFIKFDTLKGAAIADSPLVKQQHNYGFGIAFAWLFSESDTMIEVDE
ncbi:MAG: MipA/OmpV family protein [Sideroxydans sp.]|nr:MipA/OmpV family protein [Sideroxydans sp.]